MTKSIRCPLCEQAITADEPWVCFGAGADVEAGYVHRTCFIKVIGDRIIRGAQTLLHQLEVEKSDK